MGGQLLITTLHSDAWHHSLSLKRFRQNGSTEEMQKKTPIISNIFGSPLVEQPQLYVVLGVPGRDFPVDAAHPYSQWMEGGRSLPLITRAHGRELFDILSDQLGLIDVSDREMLRLKFWLSEDPNISVMRLLGKIAEAIVVRRCNQDVGYNRGWAFRARKGRIATQYLDNYMAVGTGLLTTRELHPTKYSPGNTQRDILWISKNEKLNELMQITRGQGALSAGIQLKVSNNGMRYVFPDIKNSRYEVPIVYFDLSGDFHEVANAVFKHKKENPGILVGNDFDVGIDLIRGSDIDPVCHDVMVSYRHLAEALVRGNLTVDQLIKEELLFESFKKETQESVGKRTLTL